MNAQPNGPFGRMLAIVLGCVAIPQVIALLIAPEDHRASLLGALFMVLPPVVFGVFYLSRNVRQKVNEPDRRARLDTIDRALAGMAHDLKTPLTRMRLRVESVSDDDVREKLGADIDEVNAMVTTTLAAVKGMANPEAAEPIDMNELLARLQREYAEMGRSVSVRGHARGPYVGQVSGLKRVLTNLIDNAVKFGEKASITLEDGHSLRVRVADRGPGIPPEELDRVFEPFYRAKQALSRGVDGTGLGLSIARDIVTDHGGQLRLRNRQASGLEAEVILPRVTHPPALPAARRLRAS